HADDDVDRVAPGVRGRQPQPRPQVDGAEHLAAEVDEPGDVRPRQRDRRDRLEPHDLLYERDVHAEQVLAHVERAELGHAGTSWKALAWDGAPADRLPSGGAGWVEEGGGGGRAGAR